MSRHYIIPVFVPHFGCPHDCVFCNQKKITGLSTNVTRNNVVEMIESHLLTFKDKGIIEVAFYGGSFTAIDIPTQEMLLSVAYEYKSKGLINKIRLSTRPDAISVDILKLLKRYGVDIIEIGVQSLDEDVLKLSERGHNIEAIYNSSKLIVENGFSLGLQMMLGLPGDNEKKALKTARKIIEIKPDFIRIYPTLVIKNTMLNSMYEKGEYVPISLDEAVRISGKILMACTLANISVIRIGLQPTDNIQLGKDVVAGPFHPSFRQLVETWMYNLLLKDYFEVNRENIKDRNMTIHTSNKILSAIVGQKGENKKKIIENYNLKDLKMFGSKNESNLIRIVYDNTIDEIDVKRTIADYMLINPL